MQFRTTSRTRQRSLWTGMFVMGLAVLLSVKTVAAESVQFMQSVAEAASSDSDIAAFYATNGYAPIWTGNDKGDAERRKALLHTLDTVDLHGLPRARYDATGVRGDLAQVESDRERGQIEVALSRLFLRYAIDVGTGVLTPRSVDDGLVRQVPSRDREAMLTDFAAASPEIFLKSLAPQSLEYARLMKGKRQFERLIREGGWGATAPSRLLRPGDRGQEVVRLRDRLVRMGYMTRHAGIEYDDALVSAVRRFQSDHGLATDGVAGPNTLAKINIAPETRLAQIIVAMERERWLNKPLGERHIWVNITDYHARIVDDGTVTFQTRSVVGKNADERRTPEFSDVMEYMVINPTWYVPRSIATREYLPLLKENPFAVANLKLIDAAGQVVERVGVDFTRFDEETFPFTMREPPNQGNALGLVKFMFPNRHNIYLHDTPAKSLFGREKRDFSHGCIRLNDPFDFAYVLLSKQEAEPRTFFQRALARGTETYVTLAEPVPVHIVYRTAFSDPKSGIQFRNDVYGRDAKIWRALQAAGVALGVERG